jgi:hypothetical protein
MKREKPKTGAEKAAEIADQIAAEKTKYQPTASERAALDKHNARRAAITLAPRLKVPKDGKTISLDHPDQTVASSLLMEALGSTDTDFVEGLVTQLVNASGQLDEAGLNFVLAVIKDVKPNDQLEAMLAAQMAIVHVTLMKFARHFDRIESLPQQDSAERAFNKLARTFTGQMEALKRYRTGGEQKVTVQHVSVGEGGQAIVGNVTQATPQTVPAKPAASPLAVSDARQAAMPIIEARRARVPVERRQKRNDRRSST